MGTERSGKRQAQRFRAGADMEAEQCQAGGPTGAQVGSAALARCFFHPSFRFFPFCTSTYSNHGMVRAGLPAVAQPRPCSEAQLCVLENEASHDTQIATRGKFCPAGCDCCSAWAAAEPAAAAGWAAPAA